MSNAGFPSPDKYFHLDNQPVDLDAGEKTVLDFWKWAYSDLMLNTTRGYVAQYIVAWALGIDSTPNKSWQSFDLVSPSKNKRIEVKSTAYLQSWGSVSKPLFVLQERRAWSEETGLAEKPDGTQTFTYSLSSTG